MTIRMIGALLVACAAMMPRPAAAGKLVINSWEFERGNARVSENTGKYGDYRDNHPELLVTEGEEQPWFVEYDIESDADATYALRVRYASAGEYPLDVLLDGKPVGKCCMKKTGDEPPYWDRRPNVKDGPNPTVRPWEKHGATWEDACQIKITKGKHTLKFTRNGPPANPIEMQLESKEGSLERTNPPSRRLVLSRMPVRYRNIFLLPDRVNIEALRLAIKRHIKDYGPEYPNGPRYLEELAELEKKEIAFEATSTPEKLQKLDDRLKELRRAALLDHPELKFDKLLLVVKEYAGASTYTDHLRNGDCGGNLCLLSPVSQDGTLTELVPELTNGAFGRFDISFDATKVVFCFAKAGGLFRIYEIEIDPVAGLRKKGNRLRQITFGGAEEIRTMECFKGNPVSGRGFDDIDPIYLPNGKIAFCSTRSQRSVLCFPASVTTMHIMDADGSNIRCISQGQVNEVSPAVLDDGRIVYMRWEYVDKGFGNVQSLWALRPDGSGSDHVYKNFIVTPGAMMHARSVPNSRLIVTTGAGHHGGHHGPILLIDNRRHRRTADAMENLTPEIKYPGMFPRGESIGSYRDPYPFSEDLFLVSHNPGTQYKTGAEFGIYVLDRLGNRAQLYRHPEMSCQQPMPLRPRPKPLEIAPIGTEAEMHERKLGTMFVNDVYQGLPGIERGRVKYIRVMEAENLTWTVAANTEGVSQQAAAVSLAGDVAIKYIHGLATVYEDGSALFTVPPYKNLFFQALDENYMELHRMRTFINLMPGENRSCVGCHEFRRKAPNLRDKALPMAMKLGVKPLYPQPGDPGPRAVHYETDVQPTLDKYCVGCHGEKDPKGDLVLTGEPTGLWSKSYANLLTKNMVIYLQTCGIGSSHVGVEPPMTFGSHRSKVVERMLEGPCKSKMSREEFIRIVTWIDANAPFYGTHRGKKNSSFRDADDFRPHPLARLEPLAAK